MGRHQKVQDIMKHAKKIGSNIGTITFILAVTNDKALTKFHKEYLAIKPNDENDN